ncbi:MAG TPA: DUF4215 domain-containing protein [Candidatus Moranbacteria bacterium]|nr:DUF4215 domain-containing protein [Candidatus Moranbacteria bacterium]
MVVLVQKKYLVIFLIYSILTNFFLDSSNRPFIVWLGSDGIFITRWSGSEWVKMDGSPGFEQITNEDSEAQVKEGLQLSLDSNDNPHITWSKGENNWDMDIFITRWSGSEWVKMDGSPGFEQITNRDEVIDSTSYENAYFLLDSFNNPIVIYIEFNGFYLTRWSGSEWVKMDGSPDFESVLGVRSTEIQATIDSGNNPIIALVAEIPDVMRRSLLLRYNSSYTPSAFLQSKNILSDTQTISSVTLTAETETPSGTTLGYELSFDEGANWEEVQSGVALDFSPSTDIDSMIYRIHLQTTVPQTTPIVNSVTINYTRAPFCGDGIINQPSEQCDDGNTQDGDGCSSTCQIEEEPDTPDTFTVSGVVFNDQNKDALRQAEEGLYENVTVDIIDSEDNIVSTTTTNNKGVYTFTVLEGDYTIKVTDTKKILANLDATTPQEIKLTINRDLTEQDFGYFAPIPRPIPDPTPEDPVAEDPKPEGSTSKTCSGFIGDTIWLDENGNGKEDKNEKGVNNISLKLKWAGEDNKWNTKDDKEFKTKTNRKGYYEFKGLKEGRYKVKVDEKDIKKEKLIQTYDPSGSTMDLTATVNLECNEKHTKADFGFKKEEPVKTLFVTDWNRILPKMIFWVALALSLGMSIWSWQIRKETRSM